MKRKQRESCCSDIPSGPFLMLPSSSSDQETNPQNLQFFNIQDNKKSVFPAKHRSNNLEKLINRGRCVGSSHGWLILLDKNSNPWLLNPFSDREIQLPKKETFPHIDTIHQEEEEGSEDEIFFKIKYNPKFNKHPNSVSTRFDEFQRTLIEKAILSSNPSYNKNFKVIIIYGFRYKLAFLNHNEWTGLGNSCNYRDVVWYKNNLYALLGGGRIEIWDLIKSSVPTRKACISLNYPTSGGFRFDAIQYYLAPRMGEILIIQRYIGDRVNGDGEVVDEADLLSEEESHPKVCPYRTLKFKIFKVNLIQETLPEVKSLGDEAVFVGGNHTTLLSTKDKKFEGLKRNSVYFSDNYWDRSDEDYLYGGHDIGIFSLEGESIEMMFDTERKEPTPFWVLPM